MNTDGRDERVAVIGLGQMGAAMAAQLLVAGFEVVGVDPDAGARERHEARGGTTVVTPAEASRAASRMVTSLPSAAALDAVIGGADGLVDAGLAADVIETSTLPLAVKEAAHARAEQAGVVLLDCPLSGTGAQALERDLAVYASGDPQAMARCRPLIDAFAKTCVELGPFGAGSKMKYLANLLVTIHNAAAAEAVVLGMKAGLDPQQVVEVLAVGAGTSRMLEVRGPAMAVDDYRGAGIAGSVFRKDLAIIGEFARELDCPVPLFSVSSDLHRAAVANGYGDQDTAAVCAVLEQLAGVTRPPPG